MGSIRKRERCGIIVNNKFYEIRNISENPYEFIMDPKDFYEKINNGELQAIVHTHFYDCYPSNLDIENMKVWKVYWIIVAPNCIKVYKYSDLGIIESDINSLAFKEFYNSFMKLLD